MPISKKKEAKYAGSSFNRAPSIESLPIPVIPEGYTVKMLDEPSKNNGKRKNSTSYK
ncbi:hypothetical protein NEHOM01_2081 [Nematocida homosporus]|uniref:uncharacterized protein n=1 Tax=Nematocida homosporus TaxID=1912981 RepID=UPI002220802F|nr:uncharacterized protein NEHOM01_2081 [Nematocida homosporus]KAI5187308.1 hypothetical protein NEHOM01_2081 [Nematocida homosporus]